MENTPESIKWNIKLATQLAHLEGSKLGAVFLLDTFI